MKKPNPNENPEYKSPWKTNLTILDKPKSRYNLNGYFNIPTAITTSDKGENGNSAAITIKAPPHLRVKTIYPANLRSINAVILGILERPYPIWYEIAPPMYESIPSIIRIRNGESNFVAHIIKISGGIIPRKDSEIKKISKTYSS